MGHHMGSPVRHIGLLDLLVDFVAGDDLDTVHLAHGDGLSP
jgi:hypothetical protein